MKFQRTGFIVVILLGLFLRLYGNNWDSGFHLHPDERFLTMVGNDVRLPSSISNYLDPHTSLFNPANRGHEFYVYGTLPVLINKVLAQFWYNDTYDTFNLQGRILSGLADFLIVLIIYKLVELFEKELKLDGMVKVYASFLYAIAVLPIQLSHFFAVDTFLNLFCWAAFYFSVRARTKNGGRFAVSVCLAGLFAGGAFACKVSALYFAPLIGMALVYSAFFFIRSRGNASLRIAVPAIGISAAMFYLALRFGAPYYFETGWILDPTLSKSFLTNIATLKAYESPVVFYPPSIQWISKSFLYPFVNIFFFGTGPVYTIFALAGLMLLLWKKRNPYILAIAGWALLFFVYESLQFAKTMRYFIVLYPVLAIGAGAGMHYFFARIKKLNTVLFTVLFFLGYIGITLWPLSFFSIYTKEQSRVTASKWMYDSFPSGSVILTEYWDDPLPLPVTQTRNKRFDIKEVHIFDVDTKEKWATINTQLSGADYYVLSSNRGWGSIMSVPKLYPATVPFYKKLFAGKAGYSLVATFSSYPSLRYLGIPLDLPDQWAEEAFTVYDHPVVYVFRNDGK